MRKTVFISFLATFLLIPAGCGKRPKGVLSEKEMVGLVADLEVAEGYFLASDDGDYDDKDRLAALQYVLDKHHMTKAEFDSTMTWYGKNIDDYQKLCVKVDAELARRQKRISGGEEIEEEVLSDMWPYSRHFMVNDCSASDNLTFSIKPTDLIPGDRINWKMNFMNPPEGNVMIGVEYDNGTSSYSYNSVMNREKIDISLQTDTARIVKRVFGNLHIMSGGARTLWIDSIALSRMPFDSTQYYRGYSQRKLGVLKRPEKKIELDSIDRDDEIVGTIEAEQRGD